MIFPIPTVLNRRLPWWFTNGEKPCRSDYRKFKLKTVTGPDDYASMREVLTRRFTHGMEERVQNRQKDLAPEYGSFTKFPDLILMDGGKGRSILRWKCWMNWKLAIRCAVW